MLTDPQTTVLDAVTVTMPRTSAGKDTATYRDPNFRSGAEGEVGLELIISHNYAKRTRRTVRINAIKAGAGTATFTSTPTTSMSAYIVIDTPASGFSLEEQGQVVDSLLQLLAVEDTGEVIPSTLTTRVIEGES